MRISVGILVGLGGCSELNPDYAVRVWSDGVETARPTSEGLSPAPNSDGPAQWSRSPAQARQGQSSWHFGDGRTYPAGANASLLTPEFEAGAASFLRFAYWSDVPPLSSQTATDGLVVEGQIDGGDWLPLEPYHGYTHTLDQVVLGSPLSLGEGLFAGTDRQWTDDWVELSDAQPKQTIRFRFRFGGDIDPDNNSGEGFYIDEVHYLIVE